MHDLEAPALLDFIGIDRFAGSLQLLVKEKLFAEPNWSFRTVPIVNALGQTIQINMAVEASGMIFSKSGSKEHKGGQKQT